MKLLKNIVTILVACITLTPTLQAGGKKEVIMQLPKIAGGWATLFPEAELMRMAPLAASTIRNAAQTAAQSAMTSAAFTQATEVLAADIFVKDILRADVGPEVYMPQIASAKAAYLYITFLQGTDNSLSVESVQKIKDLLEEISLLNPVTRQTWISKLESGILSEDKYPYLLDSMEKYFGFGTEEDVQLLAQQGNLENSKVIQKVTDLYKDHATRLVAFAKQHNRLPQQLSISSEEEKALARESNLLQFVKDKNNYDPVRPIMKQIEDLLQTLK